MNGRGRRPKRPDRIGRVISPLPRIFAGMAMMPPFLMIDHLPSKALLTAIFALLAVLAGKRIRWAYFLILGFSICFFHILAPVGRVLFEAGPLRITSGALENGAVRALTLMGMIFLSLAAVRPELEFPGRLGSLLARTFYHFEAILDGKANLSRKDFFSSLDRLLLERFDPRLEDFGHGTAKQAELSGGNPVKPIPGWCGLLSVVIVVPVPWVLWILELAGVSWF